MPGLQRHDHESSDTRIVRVDAVTAGVGDGRSNPDRDARFARIAWVLLDWAASGFSTVLITLVVAYFKRVAMPEGGWGLEADVIWAWTLAVAMLVSAVITSGSASWADRSDGHQRAVLVGTLVGAGGLVALAAVPAARSSQPVSDSTSRRSSPAACCRGLPEATMPTGFRRRGLQPDTPAGRSRWSAPRRSSRPVTGSG